ncbi:MAG: DNA polymerase III subunit epsilon [Alphaproteobacteria bacterium]|nr:DNA polymerase III subunit epsilon [Alphaproteobacteria bacterium]
MREIVFDTETTGLNPQAGDKIVEIGALELIDHLPTGRTYQVYLNPEMIIPEEVIKVHGITNEFVADKKTFKEEVDSFLDFIGTDSYLIAHNASFDMNFLNTELQNINKPPLSQERVIDTLVLARKRFPGSRVSLDVLCKKFGVDSSARTVHGALLDSQLLAEVYLELIGGKEPLFKLKENQKKQHKEEKKIVRSTFKTDKPWKVIAASSEEIALHETFVKKLKNPLWLKDESSSE